MGRLSQGVQIVTLMAIVAGCGPSSTTPPSGGTSSPGTSAPHAGASRDQSASPGASPTTVPIVIGLQDWTAAELYLLAGAQPKVRPTCSKAPKLPEGGYDGIQCHPAGIGTIGFYAFDDRAEMRKVYFARLAEYKVKPDSGRVCLDGKPGEGVDTPGNEGFEWRIGCYVDENGLANARLLLPSGTSGQNVYVGVVGKVPSIGSLFAALFPGHDPAAAGCAWCAEEVWTAPAESH